MKTRAALILTAALIAVAGLGHSPLPAQDNAGESTKSADSLKPVLEDLLTTPLASVDSVEVIVSRVTMPPNTALPKHWHPGEEFAYILEGSVVLWQDGKEDIVAKEGDALHIPLKQVHTAVTRDAGVTILVFRVHQAGQPARVLVE